MDGEYFITDTARLTKAVRDAVNQSLAQHLANGIAQTQKSCTTLAMTVEETAKALHLSKPTVYDLTKQPDFPCFTVGKKILVNRVRLQEWIDKHTHKEVLH